MAFDPATFLENMKLENKLISAQGELERSIIYALLHKAQEVDNATLNEEINKYYPKPRFEQNQAVLAEPISIPISPANVDIDWNIQRARSSWSPSWFLERLAPGGEMDYKNGPGNIIYEDFGNFNYGAVALAFGVREQAVLRAAGLVQILVNTYNLLKKNKTEEFIEYTRGHGLDFLGREPYGDQEKDQEMIKQGFRYYKEVYLKKQKKIHMKSLKRNKRRWRKSERKSGKAFFGGLAKLDLL
jgi:hypothetical protein